MSDHLVLWAVSYRLNGLWVNPKWLGLEWIVNHTVRLCQTVCEVTAVWFGGCISLQVHQHFNVLLTQTSFITTLCLLFSCVNVCAQWYVSLVLWQSENNWCFQANGWLWAVCFCYTLTGHGDIMIAIIIILLWCLKWHTADYCFFQRITIKCNFWDWTSLSLLLLKIF